VKLNSSVAQGLVAVLAALWAGGVSAQGNGITRSCDNTVPTTIEIKVQECKDAKAEPTLLNPHQEDVEACRGDTMVWSNEGRPEEAIAIIFKKIEGSPLEHEVVLGVGTASGVITESAGRFVSYPYSILVEKCGKPLDPAIIVR